MKVRVNVDRGIDLPNGRHESLGNVFDSSEMDAAAVKDLVKSGRLVPVEEAKASAKKEDGE